MAINSYVWGLYLKSGGDKTVEFFKKNLTPNLSIEYAKEFGDYFTRKR